MLIAVLVLAGCGGGDGSGAPIAMYHLEAQIRGPAEADGDVTCGPTAVLCPGAADEGGSATYEYAVAGDPALTEDDVVTERAQALVADVTGQAAVTLDLTDDGANAFHDFTRELVRIGRERASPQHIAIVVGGEIVSWPSIDYQQYPDGLTGDTGVQVIVATLEDAQRLAREIRGED